ncbi:hypothetical protein HEN69_021015 [Escherichia coli]|nr:hypothetical protein [Escherichia coli]MBB9739066.1 hypothetical protein [Escherichia coli]
MKYLAVLLAVLTAGSACGAELIKLVPEELTMRVWYSRSGNYEPPIDTYVTFKGANPQSLWLDITDKPYADRKVNIEPVPGAGLIQPEDGNWYYDQINGETGVYAFLNEQYGVGTYMNRAYGAPQDKLSLVYQGNKNNNFLPPSSDPIQQRVKGSCGVPENLKTDVARYQFFTTTVKLSFTQYGGGAVQSPSAWVRCQWSVRPVYDIALKLEMETMTINGTSGSNRVYDNRITVTGNGGPATIKIVNPWSRDVSVSYSDTDDGVLSKTTRPTPGGTTVPFYVLVKNTKAGTRSYNVNFTAEYN